MEEIKVEELDYWGWECTCGAWNETQDNPEYQDIVQCDVCGKEFKPILY